MNALRRYRLLTLASSYLGLHGAHTLPTTFPPFPGIDGPPNLYYLRRNRCTSKTQKLGAQRGVPNFVLTRTPFHLASFPRLRARYLRALRSALHFIPLIAILLTLR